MPSMLVPFWSCVTCCIKAAGSSARMGPQEEGGGGEEGGAHLVWGAGVKSWQGYAGNKKCHVFGQVRASKLKPDSAVASAQ